MAKDSVVAGGEDSRDPLPFPAQQRMADGVCASVDSVELPARKPPLDGPSADPGSLQLSAPYNPVLPPSQPGNPPIYATRPPFSMHRMGNGGFAGLTGRS